MIKFFRHIRQNLLMENKTGKYLKYAIGEIVLVVIGILIALQINNWNQERKARALEQSYYCLLLDDVEQDKQQLKTLKTLANERMQSSNKAIQLIQQEKTKAKELGIATQLSRRSGKVTFQPNISTYEDIKSSGNLNIIKDKRITKQLNRYFKTVEGYSNTITTNFDVEISQVLRVRNWFKTGLIHSNEYFYPDIFTKEIREKLNEDLPEYIPEDIKNDLYSDIVIGGSLHQRRVELLVLIENEIDKMYAILSKKCNLND